VVKGWEVRCQGSVCTPKKNESALSILRASCRTWKGKEIDGEKGREGRQTVNGSTLVHLCLSKDGGDLHKGLGVVV
jgi:hypothetical protein